MITDLTSEQKELADYMSALSEEAYCAAWMEGLEYELWQAMNGKISEYGRLSFTEIHREKLRELSQKIQGWIIYNQKQEEEFIPLAKWKSSIGSPNPDES